ncbi:Panacea domain-containing protein [Spirosoma litoris]
MADRHPYTQADLAKLGNAIIYLIDRIGPLSKTKLLTLIYLLQETSVKAYGLPFFNMPFLVWRLGPVAEDVFVDFSTEEPVLLSDYIQRQEQDCITTLRSRKPFSDDEFSDNEMNLLETVAQKFGSLTAKELVALTHRPHSLWHQIAREKGVLDYLEKGLMTTTDYEIDFGRLLDNMPEKQRMYVDQLEFLAQSQALKV